MECTCSSLSSLTLWDREIRWKLARRKSHRMGDLLLNLQAPADDPLLGAVCSVMIEKLILDVIFTEMYEIFSVSSTRYKSYLYEHVHVWIRRALPRHVLLTMRAQSRTPEFYGGINQVLKQAKYACAQRGPNYI